MRVTARIEVNLRTKAIADKGAGFARDFAAQLAAKTVEYAKANVAPGSGPGPHPHRPGWPHEDTGRLRASIQAEPEERGFLKTQRVFTDVEYGLYLEAGWTAKSGRHYRYPWLMPAMMQAQHEAAGIAQSTARRWFSDEGSAYGGRVNFTAPLSGTAWPE